MNHQGAHYEELKDLLQRLKKAELRYYDFIAKRYEADTKIQEIKSDLFHEGLLNGKNDDMREAQCFPHIKPFVERKNKLKELEHKAKVEMNYLRRLYNLRYPPQINDLLNYPYSR